MAYISFGGNSYGHRGQSAPQVNTYEKRVSPGGQVRGGVSAGPGLAAGQVVDEGGEVLKAQARASDFSDLARGVAQVGQVTEAEIYARDETRYAEAVNAFMEKKRLFMLEQSERKGKNALDGLEGQKGVVAATDEFFSASLNETPKFQTKKVSEQYQNFLHIDRQRSLEESRRLQLHEEGQWKQSVFAGQLSILEQGVAQNPLAWQVAVGDAATLWERQNPGLDSTAIRHDLAAKYAQTAIHSAAAGGDMATAERILTEAGNALPPETVLKLREAFDEAASKGRVRANMAAAAHAGYSGGTVEYIENLHSQFRDGALTYEEYDESLKGAKSMWESERLVRKARREEAAETAKQECVGLKAQGGLTVDWVLNNPDLPADYKERQIKEMTSAKSPSLNSVRGREIDQFIKMAIDTEEVADVSSLYTLVRQVDPDVELVSSEILGKYETRLKNLSTGNSGDPKRNYFNEAIQAVANRSGFTGDAGAEKLYAFKNAVYGELLGHDVSVHDPRAGQAVFDAVDKKEIISPGRVWDTKKEWYLVAPSTRSSLFENGNAPAVSDDGAARQELRSQGLEETEFNMARVRQGLKEGKPAREVAPDFAQSWPGRGRVTLNTLGRVNDYNELIERYALSYGIDPNLIAAQMYYESAGDPRAGSQAGAQGLMQFMPDTARRFGITDPYDPEQSIRGACRYMRWLLDRYDGSVPQALGGYNSGEGNADKNRIPRETKNYVPMIINLWMSAGADNE